MSILRSAVPMLRWLPSYQRQDLRPDIIAGLTTAVMIIPQAMGYAMLAGLPPTVGLYAALTPIAAYAVFGTSHQLSVGPVAMDSLLVAVAVSALATAGSEQYVAIAVALGLMVGVVQMLLGLLRLGYVVNFLSRPVISGFTSAAALIIAGSQLRHLMKIDLPQTHQVYLLLFESVKRIKEIHPITAVVGFGSVLLLTLLKRYTPKVPRALVAVVITTVTVVGLGLTARGVLVVGEVPAGLPGFQLPHLDLNLIQHLWPSALTIGLVSFMEAISVGKHFARENHYEVDPSQELVALGSANLAGGFFGGYPVAGGFSRTAVNASAGARTQMSALVTVSVVALTLMFLTPLLYNVPKAVLSAIIITAVLGLIDLREPVRLWKVKRMDMALLVFTFVMTLVVGIQWGILLGVGGSMLLFLVRTTRPHFAVLGRLPETEAYLNVKRHPQARLEPGVLTVRIDAQFYFGNVSFLKDTLRVLEAERGEPLTAVVLDASGVNQLDSSAEAALREIDEDYRRRGIGLFFAHVKGPVRDVMYASGWLEQLNLEGRIFLGTHDAVEYAAGRGGGRRMIALEPDPRAPADRIGCSGSRRQSERPPPVHHGEPLPHPSVSEPS